MGEGGLLGCFRNVLTTAFGDKEGTEASPQALGRLAWAAGGPRQDNLSCQCCGHPSLHCIVRRCGAETVWW